MKLIRRTSTVLYWHHGGRSNWTLYPCSYWSGRHHSAIKLNNNGIAHGESTSWAQNVSVSRSWSMGTIATRKRGMLFEDVP
jgi:hypothetical protein